MEWFQVRDGYVRQLQASGLTQAAVGRAGGLRQGTLSKLTANDRSGPSVDTLLRAIRGLGLMPSEFFAHIEQGSQMAPRASDEPDAPDDGRDPETAEDIAIELRRLRREVAELRRVIVTRLPERRGRER
jgi:transcriptional regulator with XRE-family HTH domain